MLTKSEYLLTCLAEECNEVAQRCTKAIRFGLDEVQPEQNENNRDRLAGELNDLAAVIMSLVVAGYLPDPLIQEDRQKAKREKIKKYMDYSRSLGILESN